jgi:predicted dehydrogenase
VSVAAHRVLIVGAGSIGERHLRCFLGTERADVSFVEVRAELRAEVAARYPRAKAYADLDAALEAKPTAAVLATPAPLHVGQATTLVGRGVHVLIEKPLAVVPDGVDELRRRVRESGSVVAGVAYVYRAHPVLAAMREALASGKYGRPVELVAVCGQHFPLYRPAYRQTYYTRHETGGGAVQDALTHVVNAGEWLLGPVERVVADTAHQVLDGTDVEDTVHVLARHAGIPASYSLNQHQAPNETTITVVCERGTVRFEAHACRWRSMEQHGGEWTDHAGETLERDTLFVRQANHFLDAVERKAAPACTLDEGAQTLRVNLAVLESARRGAWVSIR